MPDPRAAHLPQFTNSENEKALHDSALSSIILSIFAHTMDTPKHPDNTPEHKNIEMEPDQWLDY